MKTTRSKDIRILAIAPGTRSIGFAVMEGQEKLVDWGLRTITKGDKNKQSLKKIEEMLVLFKPDVLVVENHSAKDSNRCPRIRTLGAEIKTLVSRQKVKLAVFSRTQTMAAFFGDGKGTRHDRAKMLAERFSEELASRMPPKRLFYKSEDPRLSVFDAVALAVTFRQ